MTLLAVFGLALGLSQAADDLLERLNTSSVVANSSASDLPDQTLTPVDNSSSSGDLLNKTLTPVDNSSSSVPDEPTLEDPCEALMMACTFDEKCSALFEAGMPEDELAEQPELKTLPECDSNAACEKVTECVLRNTPVETGSVFCGSWDMADRAACEASSCCKWTNLDGTCASAIAENVCEDSEGWIIRNGAMGSKKGSKSDAGLGAGAVAGIVLAVLVAVGAVGGVIYMSMKRA